MQDELLWYKVSGIERSERTVNWVLLPYHDLNDNYVTLLYLSKIFNTG